jgi:DnaJ like chaperone protein
MGVLGKIVGGTIGFAIGGPLGAIAGAVFGHAFDVNTQQGQIEGPGAMSAGDTDQFTFFVATFSMLAKMAKSDGPVTQAEIDSVERFMREDLRLDPESRRIGMNIFRTALGAPESFGDFARQFQARFHHRRELLDLMLDMLLRVAVADGRIMPAEEVLINEAAAIFGFGPEQVRRFKGRYQKDVERDRYYAILGVDPTDSDEAVKRQYRLKVSEFHPDKIAGKGLPEEFTRFAEEKFREIQQAYEAIRAERGIR